MKKIAVVTGAASGIGAAFARHLAGDGHVVAMLDVADASAVLAEVKSAGGTAEAFRADLSAPEEVTAARREIEARFGPASVLVNNAGLHPDPPIPFAEMSWEQWRRMLAIDLDSMFLVTRAFLPGMLGQGWGRIVNMSSSVVSTVVPPGAAHYTAAKSGVIGLTKALASELAGHGITVNAIAPGLTRTPGTVHAAGAAAGDVFGAVARTQPVQRPIQPEDIVGALAYLVSDAAACVTAQVMHVDGGLTRLT